MRTDYDKLIPSLKKLLPARRLNLLGRSVSFIRRLREITASAFVWSVILSRFGSGRPGFEQARQWHKRLTRKVVWPRPFQMRFKSAQAVKLFEAAFEQSVLAWRTARSTRPKHPLAKKFPDVVAVDSTVVTVSDCLRKVFKGGSGALASIKVQFAISLFGLLPLWAKLQPGNQQDMKSFPPLDLFRKGVLYLFDKGYSAYHRLRSIAETDSYYLCPMRINGNPKIVAVHNAPAKVRKALKRHPEGVPLRSMLPKETRPRRAWDLEVSLRIQAGTCDRTPVRTRLVLLPGRRGKKQHPYLTNLDPRQWAPAMLGELYRLRWQIELVFKELKQHLNLTSVPTKDPHAAKVFVWASLTALALSRTVTAWLYPLARVVGLASKIRPMLMTRALRATIRLLGRALTASTDVAIPILRLFVEEIFYEARSLQTQREDSFKRLLPMFTCTEAA